MSAPARSPARVERAFAGAYLETDTEVLAAAVASAGPAVAATGGGLSVAWTGPLATAPPLAGASGCLLDGEIYNLEAIARLADVPAGTGPEATLAAAFAHLGEGIITHLRGEFALLLWDPRTNTALLARDQLGAGGFFVHAEGARLRFASELPYLLDSLPRTPGPDRDALVQWLAEGAVAPDRTLYERVVPLPPASLLRLRDGRWESARYWSPSFVDPRPLNLDEAAEELRNAVINSVTSRLQGRRTAGVLVSGGLDSGAVLGACARARGATETSLRSYSAVFPAHPSMDESELIAMQTRHHGIPGSQVAVTEGSPLGAALRYLDRWRATLPVPGLFLWEPLLDKAARDGAQCMLDGQLGDELFGAAALLLADRLREGRLNGALRLARSYPGAGPSPSWRFLISLLCEFGVAPSIPPTVARLGPARRPAPWWLSRSEARRYERSVDPQSWRTLEGPRWWAQQADVIIRRPERLGFHEYFRRRSRAAGVAAQHPFLDLGLIDVVLSLPPEHGFDPSLTRPLLRKAMRGLVPEEIRLRSGKSYFNALMVDCLTVNDRDLITGLLAGSNVEVMAIADAAGVRALLERGPAAHPRSASGWALDVWRLATAESWLRSQSHPGFALELLDGQCAHKEGHGVGPRPPATRSYVSPP